MPLPRRALVVRGVLGLTFALWASVGAAQDCATARQAVADARRHPASSAADLTALASLYERALALCPAQPDALNNLADTYERLKRYAEAITLYQRAAEAYRELGAPAHLRATPLFGLGDVYRTLGNGGLAVYWYRKGLELQPDDKTTVDAVTELTMNDPPGLVESHSIAAAIDPDSRAVGVAAAVQLNERVLPFAYDSAELLPAALPQLREIAHALMERLSAGARSLGVLAAAGPPVAEIGGHADRRGADEYNRDLAARRAQAVVEALVVGYHIPRERITVASYGKSRPLCLDETEACHSRNRRVEIRRP